MAKSEKFRSHWNIACDGTLIRMDRDLERSLDLTEDQLREEREHLQHEKQFIERARKEGHETSVMQRSRQAMRHFQHALKMHQRILLERLGLYRQ